MIMTLQVSLLLKIFFRADLFFVWRIHLLHVEPRFPDGRFAEFVEVPQEHINAGLVTVTKTQSGGDLLERTADQSSDIFACDRTRL